MNTAADSSTESWQGVPGRDGADGRPGEPGEGVPGRSGDPVSLTGHVTSSLTTCEGQLLSCHLAFIILSFDYLLTLFCHLVVYNLILLPVIWVSTCPLAILFLSSNIVLHLLPVI